MGVVAKSQRSAQLKTESFRRICVLQDSRKSGTILVMDGAVSCR
jgi:hypothetical protein